MQEAAVLQLKQELLRCSMSREQLEGENVSQMIEASPSMEYICVPATVGVNSISIHNGNTGIH